MSTPKFRAELLDAEVHTIREYLGSLDADDLQKPSACEGWTIADVIAHLAGQPFAARVKRGLLGDISPDEGALAVADHDEDQFARSIFDRARSTRAQHGEELLEVLDQRLDESVDVFTGVSPGEWDTLCYWPPGPEPVRTLLDMRISELTMHAWDIRSVLEDQYHLSSDSIRVLVDTVDRAVRRAFRPDPSLEKPVRHRFVLGDPANLSRDIVVTTEGAQVEPAGADLSDVTFRCDGETYVLVMYGRLKIDAVIADGRLSADGNAEIASGFGQRFVGG